MFAASTEGETSAHLSDLHEDVDKGLVALAARFHQLHRAWRDIFELGSPSHYGDVDDHGLREDWQRILDVIEATTSRTLLEVDAKESVAQALLAWAGEDADYLPLLVAVNAERQQVMSGHQNGTASMRSYRFLDLLTWRSRPSLQ